MFIFFGATEANATVNLTIHNTGCEDMKVYKKDWGWETYQTTIVAGSSWSCWTWFNQEFVFRKMNGSYMSNYNCGSSSTQNHNCDSGGCNTGGACGNLLAHWNLNACSAGSSYAEFTAATSTPTGFSAVSASILSSVGDHSCNYGQSGEGICHAITDGCSFVNNDNNAYKFSVTINPASGKSATLGKLTFYESAPANYAWVGGGSGDNDPPSKYGVRVTKNGTEIFKQVDIATTAAWSLETIDFAGDADFTVTSQTTFNVELLGYCRQGANGYAVWDIDEVKAYGCTQNADPCAINNYTIECEKNINDAGWSTVADCNVSVCPGEKVLLSVNPNGYPTSWTGPNGFTASTNDILVANSVTLAKAGAYTATVNVNGCIKTKTITLQVRDTDGDGVCNENDCQPNNPAFPATPGSPCNDGNANTTNDVVTANGCGCAGTVPNPCANLGGDTDGDGVCNNNDCQPNNPAFPATPGSPCNDGNANTTNDVVTANGCGCAGTVPNPCANLGGDTDGDGVCNNNDCQPNNPAFPATPGSPCNDGNANTTNDVVTANGCGCAGTTVPPVCDNITNGGTIGFGANCQSTASIACNTAAPNITNCASPTGGTGALETIWLKSTTTCSMPTTTAAQIIAGLDPHWVLIPGQNGLTLTPGTVSANTCYLRCTRRAGCDNYLESNIISLTTDCGGGGTPNCTTGITITSGTGTIIVTGLGGAPISSVQVLTSTWQPQYSCFANCGASQTINVPAGTYYVYAKYYTAGYQLICEKQMTVTVGGGNPCANAGGDTDGDGTCNNNDCQPNNPAFPATPGSACNDGNANTTNDVVTGDGCGCAGTPVVNPCANLGGDTDGDGVCNNNDCQPNNPAFPATPGTACNDGNANTTNDVVTANGCGCAGTPVNNGPDCNTGITITTGIGTITVTGLGAAPISSVQVLTSTWQPQYSCFANCGASQTINVPAGTYYIYAKYYTAGYALICEKQATITVTGGNPCANAGGDTDGDGICNNNDCQPNNPAFPATPGTSCNDGNANTTNDVVTANGCGCAGTHVNNNNCVVGTQRTVTSTNDNCGTWCGGAYALTFGPNNCWTAGTDLVFKEFPNGTATLTGTVKKGTSTMNVNLNFTGKTSAAPANSPHYDLCVSSGGSSWYYYTNFSGTIGSYNITKYGPAFQVGNGANLQDNTFGASGWFSFGGSSNGDLNFKLGASSNITGPDADNDGTCDATDCQPNNAAYPATPGTTCNDGNASTTNDVVQADGCTCAGTPSSGGGSGGNWCKIGKRVWHDKNNDGIFNGNDSGISGCWVNLRDHLGNSLGWKVSDSQGYFNFDNLQPGGYKLSYSTPGGFIPTLKHAGSDVNNDSDIDYWSGLTDLISLVSGQYVDNCDAGYKTGQYLIGQSQGFKFDVKKEMEHSSLFWSHDGGSLVNIYIVERSADGINFEALSEFNSRGGAANEFYEDFDIEPMVGDNYYRIAIHRLDGNIAYSNVKKVEFADLVDYQLFPNPANDFVSVNLASVIGKSANIQLFNNLGVKVKGYQLDEVWSKYYQMDIRDLREGHYIVWLNVPGKRPIAKKLIVGKL
ncbi:MAG: hypothetical protein IPN76_15320 [Saprospiraceae bacterium]|nr:hypothetical protein [Saprospiraceae bacterium]